MLLVLLIVINGPTLLLHYVPISKLWPIFSAEKVLWLQRVGASIQLQAPFLSSGLVNISVVKTIVLLESVVLLVPILLISRFSSIPNDIMNVERIPFRFLLRQIPFLLSSLDVIKPHDVSGFEPPLRLLASWRDRRFQDKLLDSWEWLIIAHSIIVIVKLTIH